MILFLYILSGTIIMVTLMGDVNFNKNGLLTSYFERLVFIWAWPAFLVVIFLFRWCRDADTDPEGVL